MRDDAEPDFSGQGFDASEEVIIVVMKVIIMLVKKKIITSLKVMTHVFVQVEINLEDDHYGPLREWIVLDAPRREIARRFCMFLATYVDHNHNYPIYKERIQTMCLGVFFEFSFLLLIFNVFALLMVASSCVLFFFLNFLNFCNFLFFVSFFFYLQNFFCSQSSKSACKLQSPQYCEPSSCHLGGRCSLRNAQNFR